MGHFRLAQTPVNIEWSRAGAHERQSLRSGEVQSLGAMLLISHLVCALAQRGQEIAAASSQERRQLPIDEDCIFEITLWDNF